MKVGIMPVECGEDRVAIELSDGVVHILSKTDAGRLASLITILLSQREDAVFIEQNIITTPSNHTPDCTCDSCRNYRGES